MADSKRDSATPRSGRGRGRWLRWTGGFVAAVCLPKCLLCVAGYFAVGTGFIGLGPELCGAATTDFIGNGELALTGLGLGIASWLVFRSRRRMSGAPRLVRCLGECKP